MHEGSRLAASVLEALGCGFGHLVWLGGEQAFSKMPVVAAHPRRDHRAFGKCLWAAWMKAAAGRDVRWVRRRLAEPDIGNAAPGFRREHRGEQRLRVGMGGTAE